MKRTPVKNDRSSFPAALDVLQRYTIEETCQYLRQSRAKTYIDIAEGRLVSFKDGRRTYVTGRSIVARSLPPKQPIGQSND